MSLENLTSALEQSVIPILLIFALVFLFFSGRLILQRMGFGSKPLVTARIFLRSFAKQSLAEVWKRQLSPQLKEKICGEGFADAEALGQGLEHLTAFRERHSVAFPSDNSPCLVCTRCRLVISTGSSSWSVGSLRTAPEGWSFG